MGDRLLLVMPHTARSGALTTMKRIAGKLAALDFDISGKLIKVTLSIGIADNSGEESIFYDSILKRAESGIKKVLTRGGNGTEVYNPEEDVKE